MKKKCIKYLLLLLVWVTSSEILYAQVEIDPSVYEVEFKKNSPGDEYLQAIAQQVWKAWVDGFVNLDHSDFLTYLHEEIRVFFSIRSL